MNTLRERIEQALADHRDGQDGSDCELGFESSGSCGRCQLFTDILASLPAEPWLCPFDCDEKILGGYERDARAEHLMQPAEPKGEPTCPNTVFHQNQAEGIEGPEARCGHCAGEPTGDAPEPSNE